MNRNRKRVSARTKLLLGAIAWGLCWFSSGGVEAANTITWKGIQWNVKSEARGNPGGNSWSPANAFIDASGDLHLAITNDAGTWNCAEVWTSATFGFGTIQWQINTAVDSLDPNVVLGLFAYGPPALGPDGTHEIDIEYSRFGSPTGDVGRWTVWPNAISNPPVLGRTTFPLQLGSTPATTSRFTWAPSSVAFATLGGFQPPSSTANTAQAWAFVPGDPSTTISQSPMPIHMNLWLYNGNPPTNGQGVEVVIHDFSDTAASAGSPSVPALPGHRVLVLAACLIAVGLSSAASSASWRRGRRRRHGARA
jgi:hypothetical protein